MKVRFRPPRTERGIVRSSVVLDASVDGVDEVWLASAEPPSAPPAPQAMAGK